MSDTPEVVGMMVQAEGSMGEYAPPPAMSMPSETELGIELMLQAIDARIEAHRRAMDGSLTGLQRVCRILLRHLEGLNAALAEHPEIVEAHRLLNEGDGRVGGGV